MTSLCIHLDANMYFTPRAIMFVTYFLPQFNKKDWHSSITTGGKAWNAFRTCHAKLNSGYLQKTRHLRLVFMFINVHVAHGPGSFPFKKNKCKMPPKKKMKFLEGQQKLKLFTKLPKSEAIQEISRTTVTCMHNMAPTIHQTPKLYTIHQKRWVQYSTDKPTENESASKSSRHTLYKAKKMFQSMASSLFMAGVWWKGKLYILQSRHIAQKE